MRDEALALIRGVAGPAAKLNLLREYVQALPLRSLHESEAFAQLAFVGGTALRFAYNLPRFSEDLDFSLVRREGYLPESWLRKVKRDLGLAGLDASVSFAGAATVHKAWVKVPGILREAGLAAMAGQKLSIKLEIDTRPPAGSSTVRTLINRHRLLALQLHALPSLMAGKVHALATRKYAKGRDWYDLVWYLARRPPVEPDLGFLQNAFDQTSDSRRCGAEQWRSLLVARLAALNWGQVRADVEPFLERPEEAALLCEEHLRSLLASKE